MGRNRGNNLRFIFPPDGSEGRGKVQLCGLKKDSGSRVASNDINCMVRQEKKSDLPVMVSVRNLLKLLLPNPRNKNGKTEIGGRETRKKDLKTNDFAAPWSLLVRGPLEAVPGPFKANNKRIKKMSDNGNGFFNPCELRLEPASTTLKNVKIRKEGKQKSFQCFLGLIFGQLALNLHKLDHFVRDFAYCSAEDSYQTPWFSMNVNGFQGNLRFARVGDLSSSIVGAASSASEIGDTTVEQLRSTLSTASLNDLIKFPRPSAEHPDKKKLMSAQDFFGYSQAEGRRFFEELDRDGDGEVTLEDLEIEMRKRKLPKRYAREFMKRTKRHFFSKSFGWKQFCSLMEQKEPDILRAYTSLRLDESGTLQKSYIVASLESANLPATEDSAAKIMLYFKTDTEGSISYGHFQNYMLLLPHERLQDDPRKIWVEAATAAVASTVDVPTESVLKSALAGGFSCAFSSFVMHPVDTVKTRVQASTVLSFPQILAKVPEIGVQGLYKGSIPTVVGQFSSHGLRTGLCEASKIVLTNVAPSLPDIQVESISSFCSTVLGTVARIPCEVLKQRLQAGIFDNIGEALVGTWQQDGIKGFFRGTGATLCREVPFYVAGMGLYNESKKVVQKILGRELEAWETVVVGAVSGGLASVTTTPFDVIKTRMMTEMHGQSLSMSMVGLSILRHEGPLALFKGAVPRFFWIAPLGAMNFAGYELLRKAMDSWDLPSGESNLV